MMSAADRAARRGGNPAAFLPAPAHSELGASSCYRWSNCPGSVRMSRGMPARSSAAAELGTAAHAVAEICLQHGQDAIEYVGRVVRGVEIDARAADKVQSYLDDCRAYDGPPEFAWTEVRFDLAPLNPPAPMFGTADRVEYVPAEKLLRVKDYKNGYLRVEPTTPQLRYYALGATIALGADYPVSRVEVTIAQPEHGEPRRHTYDAVEIAEWSAELMDWARAATAPDAPLVAGPWCKFCPAAGVCDAQARRSLAAAQMEFGVVVDAPPAAEPTPPPVPETLTPEQMARILERADEFISWLAAVRAHAAAVGVPGWKVVATEGRQTWRDKDGAAAMLESVHDVDPWEPRVIASPAQVRGRLATKLQSEAAARWEAAGRPKGLKPTKKAAEGHARDALRALTVWPTTGTALVPDSDPRPAIDGRGAEFPALPSETGEPV